MKDVLKIVLFFFLIPYTFAQTPKDPNLQQYKQAIQKLTEKIKKDPKDPLHYYYRGVIRSVYFNEYESAIQDFSKTIELNSKYSEAYDDRGVCYRELKQYDKAIEDLDKAILFNPKDSRAYYNLGLTYHYKGDYDKAIENYSEVVRIAPRTPDAYFNRAKCYYILKKQARALEDYTRVIRLVPTHDQAYFERGLISVELAEVKTKEIEHYDSQLKINGVEGKKNSQQDKKLKTRYAQLKDSVSYYYKSALSDYTQAIKLNKAATAVYNARGYLYKSLKNYSEGIADYTVVIQNEPSNSVAYVNRGYCYYYSEQKTNACNDWKKALEFKHAQAQELVNAYCQ